MKQGYKFNLLFLLFALFIFTANGADDKIEMELKDGTMTNLMQQNQNAENNDDQEEEDCAICIEPVTKEEAEKSLLQCDNQHRYHPDCIEKWVKQYHHDKCPLCRQKITVLAIRRNKNESAFSYFIKKYFGWQGILWMLIYLIGDIGYFSYLLNPYYAFPYLFFLWVQMMSATISMLVVPCTSTHINVGDTDMMILNTDMNCPAGAGGGGGGGGACILFCMCCACLTTMYSHLFYRFFIPGNTYNIKALWMVLFMIQIIIIMVTPHLIWKPYGEGEGNWVMSEVITHLFQKFFKMIGTGILDLFKLL